MQNKGRRPPINLEDLQGGEEEQDSGPGRGSLSYAQPAAPPPPRKGGGQKFTQNTQGGNLNLANLLVSVIAAAAISFLLVNQMAASKAELTTFQTNTVNQAQQSVNALRDTVANDSRRIDNIISSQSNYVSSATLSNYALKSDTVTRTDYYTKADIDELLKKKADKGSTTTSTSTTTTPGTTTTTSGTGFSITMDKSQIISTATDTGNKDITVTVVNNTGVGKNTTLLVSLVPLSPSSYDTTKVSTYTAYSTLTGWTAATVGTKQSHPDVSTLVQKILWIAPNYWMDIGASKVVWLHFDVKTVDVVTWNLLVQVMD